jgi:hypothetical protein
LLVSVVKQLPFATFGLGKAMVDIVMCWVACFVTEGEEEVVPAFVDTEVGIGGIKVEVNVMSLAVEYGEHHVVEF